ncbi:ABC transporter ATP-binding protein [Curtobacterium sp. Leaf261]|uniref:ABC transporter ATP-binding protein n=1 Tax=Curtobacterium sp. Leaf261 TaxID=1736311 RepID=UPI0006FD27B2|nr:ABC transporter ATP-binding protein [Curtobacterium sp. Leaf261]KQO64556.1 ABC transporter ATP-binding protein [Curtobacterium sp. Leaf261]
MDTPVLEARGLTRTYGRGDARFDALKGVSLAVGRGESLAIVGKSGSGKSTLMHLLALLDRPSNGQVMLDGQDAARLSARQVNQTRNSTFGFVFQQFFLTPKTNVLDNVVLPLKIAGVSGRERRQRGLEALDALGIADKAKNDANDLSGGQKQRVVIARALVNDPAVIFADEPTGNLDTTTGELVEDMLFGLQRERGITLVVVTHDRELATRCDRSVNVRDGLIVDQQEAAA